MNRALIAFDFSPYARRALALAMQGFPFGREVELELLHVIDESLYESVLARRQLPSADAIESYLRAELARVRAELDEQRPSDAPALLEPVVTIVRGRAHAIIDAHLHAPQIVGGLLGGQGHGGAKERLLGRTAQRVIRHADVPVLVIERPGSSLLPRRLLAAVDWSENSSRALLIAGRLARELAAPLAVVHAVESPYVPYVQIFAREREADEVLAQIQAEQLERLAGFVRETLAELDAPPTPSERVVFGQPAEAIASTAEAVDAELILVGARGQTDLRRFLLGTTAEQLIVESARDVLVIP